MGMTIKEAIEELQMALDTYAGIEIQDEALIMGIEALKKQENHKMTLSDAIQHAKEVVETQRRDFEICGECDGLTFCKRKTMNPCLKCANEHEQLVEWLTELDERRKRDKEIEKVCVLIKQDDAVATIVDSINHDDITEEMKNYLFSVIRPKLWNISPVYLMPVIQGENA